MDEASKPIFEYSIHSPFSEEVAKVKLKNDYDSVTFFSKNTLESIRKRHKFKLIALDSLNPLPYNEEYLDEILAFRIWYYRTISDPWASNEKEWRTIFADHYNFNNLLYFLPYRKNNIVNEDLVSETYSLVKSLNNICSSSNNLDVEADDLTYMLLGGGLIALTQLKIKEKSGDINKISRRNFIRKTASGLLGSILVTKGLSHVLLLADDLIDSDPSKRDTVDKLVGDIEELPSFHEFSFLKLRNSIILSKTEYISDLYKQYNILDKTDRPLIVLGNGHLSDMRILLENQVYRRNLIVSETGKILNFINDYNNLKLFKSIDLNSIKIAVINYITSINVYSTNIKGTSKPKTYNEISQIILNSTRRERLAEYHFDLRNELLKEFGL